MEDKKIWLEYVVKESVGFNNVGKLIFQRGLFLFFEEGFNIVNEKWKK